MAKLTENMANTHIRENHYGAPVDTLGSAHREDRDKMARRALTVMAQVQFDCANETEARYMAGELSKAFRDVVLRVEKKNQEPLA